MTVIIHGIDIPKKHHMNGYYISDDGKVFDISRKTVVGKAVQISSIEPERKKGKWICQADDYIWNCSECDFEIDGTGCIDPLEYLKIYNFCPNCGADVRGEQDEAE